MRKFFPLDLVNELRGISDNLSRQAVSVFERCQVSGMSPADWAKNHPSNLIVVPEVDSPTQVCRYEFMIGSDLPFMELIKDCVDPIVTELVGDSVTPFKDKTNEKLPGGGGFGPHQDFAAYQAFQPRYHATAMLTIHPANLTNGCLQFATNFDALVRKHPGSALNTIEGKALLHYHSGGLLNGDIRADIASQIEWESLQTDPEDLVVFVSFIPHRSDVNRSSEPRRAVFVTFNRISEGSLTMRITQKSD